MTKLTTIAIALMTISFNASANFQPWEPECDKYRANEVHEQSANVKSGSFYRDEATVIRELPDSDQQIALQVGPFYRQG